MASNQGHVWPEMDSVNEAHVWSDNGSTGVHPSEHPSADNTANKNFSTQLDSPGCVLDYEELSTGAGLTVHQNPISVLNFSAPDNISQTSHVDQPESLLSSSQIWDQSTFAEHQRIAATLLSNEVFSEPEPFADQVELENKLFSEKIFDEAHAFSDEVYPDDNSYLSDLYSEDVLFDMSSRRSQRPMADSLQEHENFNNSLSTAQSPPWPGNANENGILGNIREIEDEELSSIFDNAAPVTEPSIFDRPTNPPSANLPAWGPTHRPSSWDFTIYEDPPENAARSVPTSLAEGFHSMDEDKENIFVNPLENESSSSSSDGELRPYIDLSEVAHRPRDAFGIPVGYDGYSPSEQLGPSAEGAYFRRGRHVLASLATPGAENSDDEDRAFARVEAQMLEEVGEEDDDGEL